MNKNFIYAIIYNIVEIGVVILCGLGMNIELLHILFVLSVFIILRMSLPKPMHYKSPYLCFMFTLLLFLSMFIVLNIELGLSLIISLLAGFVLTSKGNVTDITMFKGKNEPSKYQILIDYLELHEHDEKTVTIEKQFEETEPYLYMIYKRKFKDKLSFSKICDEFNMENKDLVKQLDCIYMHFLGELVMW